jgi:hypothetical protein
VTRGSSYENRANLAGAFLQQIIKKYEGTRLGRRRRSNAPRFDIEGNKKIAPPDGKEPTITT